MKSIILFVSVLFLFSGCNAQNPETTTQGGSMKYSFINNNKIKYSIVLTSCDTCIPITNIGYRVKVQLTKKEEIFVRKISSSTWDTLLNNINSDWAANLILYHIYDKDALLLSRNNNKELWTKYLKNDDISFWRQKLQKK